MQPDTKVPIKKTNELWRLRVLINLNSMVQSLIHKFFK